MKLGAHTLLLGLPLLATLLSAPASAQNVAAADALFQKGMEEMEKKNYKVACPSFRESYKLDPVPGALHALASCHMEAGEVASAVVRFDEYLRVVETLPPAQKAKHAVRAKDAKAHRAALAPQVPELTLVLPAEAPPGTRVIQDSVELSAISLGLELPIDPGEHMVTTQAPGGPVKEHRFTIEKGEKKRLELTLAEPERANPAPPSKASETRQVEAASRPGPRSGEERPGGPGDGAGTSGYRIGAFVAGGIGAAALVGGIVAGVIVLGKKGTIDESCIGTKCNPESIIAAREAAEGAQVPGVISTVGFVIGGAGLAAGAVLFLLEPSEKAPEGHGQRRPGSIGVGLTSAGPFELTAGIKGAW
jgi:hypothetical protein